ncbi:MAG: hypothetical protein RR454_00410 [Clostridia bacterium]
MIKVKMEDIGRSYYKGNILMLLNKFGYINIVNFLVLWAISVVLYFETKQAWSLILTASIFGGFCFISTLHVLIVPLIFRRDMTYEKVFYAVTSFEEDKGMIFEGYSKSGDLLRIVNVFWDDVNKVMYNKKDITLICNESDIFVLNKSKIEYLNGNESMLISMLKRNIDRRIFKIDIAKARKKLTGNK